MRGAYVTTRPVTNTYLVRERDRRMIRELLLVVILAAPPVVGALANTWLRTQVVHTGYDIHRKEKALADLERAEKQLRLEWTQLSSPAELEKRARVLGLVEPDLEQVERLGAMP